MIALVIGGSGSGKSAIAERLICALPAEKRIYLATMQAADEESRRRVLRHRAQRAGLGFVTVEAHRDVGKTPGTAGAAVLLEDLPNLVAGEMFGGGDAGHIEADLRRLAASSRHLVMVTGNLFADGLRYPAVTEAYLRRLAEVNRAAAALADYAAEAVCGVPAPLKGEAPCAW